LMRLHELALVDPRDLQEGATGCPRRGRSRSRVGRR
jgi:hypothetical protein